MGNAVAKLIDPIIHSRMLKNTIDRVLAVVGIVVISPIFLVVAIILKIQREDVFFLQDRVGLDQKTFRIYKFTTMVKGAEKAGTITARNDLRVTSLGKFLRQLKLNEIPQLINVIRGEMSFVGPRPLPVSEVERYYRPEDAVRIYSVKPGITGFSSIEFSDEDKQLDQVDNVEEYYAQVIVPRKAALETWYVDNCSLILDAKLLFRTILKLLNRFACPVDNCICFWRKQ